MDGQTGPTNKGYHIDHAICVVPTAERQKRIHITGAGVDWLEYGTRSLAIAKDRATVASLTPGSYTEAIYCSADTATVIFLHYFGEVLSSKQQHVEKSAFLKAGISILASI